MMRSCFSVCAGDVDPHQGLALLVMVLYAMEIADFLTASPAANSISTLPWAQLFKQARSCFALHERLHSSSPSLSLLLPSQIE